MIAQEVRSHFINEPSGTLNGCRETTFPPLGVAPLRAQQLDGSPLTRRLPLCGFFMSAFWKPPQSFERCKHLHAPHTVSAAKRHTHLSQCPLLDLTESPSYSRSHSAFLGANFGPFPSKNGGLRNFVHLFCLNLTETRSTRLGFFV